MSSTNSDSATSWRAIAVAPAAISFFDADGELLFREPRGIDGGYGYPQYSVHRGRLQMLLLSAVRDRLGPDAVHDGRRAHRLRRVRRPPHGRTPRQATSTHECWSVPTASIPSFALALHPEPDPLMWSGLRMFRGAVDGEPFLDGRTMAIVKGANGVDLVAYPIGGGQSTGL